MHLRCSVYSAPSRHGHTGPANRSPLSLQNGHAEGLIGSIRRECLDHVIVFGERHLQTLLHDYQSYYNECRTHLSLEGCSTLACSSARRPHYRQPCSWRTASSILPSLSFRQGQAMKGAGGIRRQRERSPSRSGKALRSSRNAIERQVSELDRRAMKPARRDAQIQRFMTVPVSALLVMRSTYH